PENEAAYMMALDSALLDRHISVTDGEHLIEVARQSGLGRGRIIELHRDYLAEMAKVALDDGVVTGDEREELERVADGLGLGPADVDQALILASEFRQSAAKHVGAPGAFLARGDRVVFTGAMRRNRDSWIELIVQAGLASGGVTKSTRLLVTADPDSMSGKAGKARGFGVPVVDEEAFERMFAEYCASTATV
ncbi:MAG: polC 1, partial [Nocardioides sp.]|nr:polC 1 [Nocardioides sp.]